MIFLSCEKKEEGKDLSSRDIIRLIYPISSGLAALYYEFRSIFCSLLTCANKPGKLPLLLANPDGI